MDSDFITVTHTRRWLCFSWTRKTRVLAPKAMCAREWDYHNSHAYGR